MADLRMRIEEALKMMWERISGSVSAVNDRVDSIPDWAKAETKPTYTPAEVGAIPTTEKGSTGGVAELDNSGKVPSSQLPSYVDDVLEYNSIDDFPLIGETGKIYVDNATNLTYRWAGSRYVEISPSLALGETSSTAYRGDRGKAAYEHAQYKGNAYDTGLYLIQTNHEGHVIAAVPVDKNDIVNLGLVVSDLENDADYATLSDIPEKVSDLNDDIGILTDDDKGRSWGVAELDADGLLDVAQIPSGVYNVQEYENRNAFPATGQTSTIYIAIDTNFLYRWTGSAYVTIGAGSGVTGVKGDAESSYRQGNVNLTPANIGAVSSASGSHTVPINWSLIKMLSYYDATINYDCFIAAADDKKLKFRVSRYQDRIEIALVNQDYVVKLGLYQMLNTSECGYIVSGYRFRKAINLGDENGLLPITIPQGGTGGKTPAEARANLEITPANIGAVAKTGDTMTGPLTMDSSLFGALGSTGFRIVGADGALSYLCTENDFYGSGGGWNHFIICNHGNGETYYNYVLRLPFWDSPKYKRQMGGTSYQTPWYDFLTSEKTVTVSQGGTGATTAAQARANLELTPSASQMIATGIYVLKVGDLAFIACDGNNVIALPPRTWVTLGYLPNGYVSYGHFYGTIPNGQQAEQSGIMHIMGSGTVQYFNSGTVQTTALWGSMSFPISNN